ncbi:UNVERIFIED_CONTAM: hypothetical protein K2H54_037794, partial [Gekko kuhli]
IHRESFTCSEQLAEDYGTGHLTFFHMRGEITVELSFNVISLASPVTTGALLVILGSQKNLKNGPLNLSGDQLKEQSDLRKKNKTVQAVEG